MASSHCNFCIICSEPGNHKNPCQASRPLPFQWVSFTASRYGAYEVANDPGFHREALALLDRGFIYAIAHIRGGGEMGRAWYEDGKYLHKINTFKDFIAAAEHLVQQKYTSPARLCIEACP